ncbi:DUF4258 domain-containing protein [candidate division WOR-3 bacterium]|uniref:DUF4258 domain-containing protein n=1 Tax=candidate division WOR-3 bacterium TaxID=2052148 RepID=A0A938BR01_UNCW3|nr:DUF4258 domain-containing protein [candidate division WOR-3 bacterium]
MKPVRFSQHARLEIARRGVPLKVVEEVFSGPEQVVSEQGGLMARQSRVGLEGKQYLVRVVVAERPDATVVVTGYRTSKIGKYWRSE